MSASANRRVRAFALAGAALFGCSSGGPPHAMSGAATSSVQADAALPSTTPTDDPLRFDSLRALIVTRAVRSIDELLPLLPEGLRSRYVLIFQSRSTQEASYANPRVLLFTRDARFVLSFNGDPKEGGYDALETMELDAAQRALRFREVLFPRDGGEAASVVFSEPNPRRCVQCHGPDPRPIWDTYPTWPGVYGEQDHAPPDPEEAAGFDAFVARRPESARYRAVLLAASVAQGPGPLAAAVYEGRSERSRNADFGVRLQILQYLVIARVVTGSPRFHSFRYALLASLDRQCLGIDDFLPSAVKATFRVSFPEFEGETERADAQQALAKRMRARRDPVKVVPKESLTAFRYLAEEGLGLSTRGWTLALEKGTYDFTSDARPTRVLEREVLRAIAPTDLELGGPRAEADHRDGYCVMLRKRSLEALGTSPGRPVR